MKEWTIEDQMERVRMLEAEERGDPLAFDYGLDFRTAPTRLTNERDERLERARKRLRYHHGFLDDVTRGIGANDLVLLGAETGAGKTDMATSIAKANARAGKRVFYFALEAEPKEIERRTKYALIVELAVKASDPRAAELTYIDWICGRADGVAAKYETAADAIVQEQLSTLHTYYRGAKFDLATLKKLFLAVQTQADLVVIDHLHYVDIDDDETENRGYKRIVQAIRGTAIDTGVPVILVAHLRKRDLRARQIVPHMEDFHGSSDLIKNATHAIQIAPARIIASPSQKPYLAPTFVHVPKDRHVGANHLVALCWFDRRYRTYLPSYTLGRLTDGGTNWEPIREGVPRWAEGHKAVTT